MNKLKKFWIVFLSLLPFSAGAVAPLVIGGIAGIGVIAGFSIYRSVAPVNMADALSFFSTCWSCQMFSDVMATMSNLLPRAYNAIGHAIIPMCIALTAVWFAWKLLSGYLGINKAEEPWAIAGIFGTHIVKLGFVIALLAFPLPRLLTNAVIEPVFNVGLSLNRVVTGNEKISECVVATALADPISIDGTAANSGAYSPKLRHNLACELAGVHQMTGLGMTVGWTMLNMSFNSQYMHKILWNVPFFPNIPIFFIGLLILVLFFFALLPIPLYFLEIFIKLSMNLIMLPMFLMGWLFKDWSIIPGNGAKSIQDTVNEVIKGTAGIAMIGVFVSFAIIFLNSVFGNWQGAAALQTALAKNDSTILMDGLMMNNDSLITIVLMGLFIAMFIAMITTLIKTLFANVEIPDTYYKTTKDNIDKVWGNIKKWYTSVSGAVKK
ncbi:MAG: hypothetical protein JW974_01890 [Alphaproteobacteria bacterium]|nr:hypothetical protein [Alphaproteobacteria bacterium]MBN2675531.1 hypothetical protein [Alphaproteobacteria bacterium]